MSTTATKLHSWLGGKWVSGTGAPAVLVNPSTEAPVAEIAGGGLDMQAALDHARNLGGPALRELTFKQRGALLREMARVIHANRDALIALAIENGGNTRGDAKFDIDGASGTLGHYADLADGLGDKRLLVDGEGVQMGRSPRLWGQHVLSPRAGVAVHINAFNFPAWGTAEKAACALLAGMPVLSKPATATALVAHRIVQLVVDAKILPEGTFQLLLGNVGDLLDRLGGQDVLAFTGSGATGAKLRGGERVVRDNVRVNIEADSLNAAVLGPDVEPGSPTWDLFVTDVTRDITQKTGQKCTAIRRVMVPAAILDAVRDELSERLGRIKVGNPASEDITMGPLATAAQLRDVRAGLGLLLAESERVFGSDGAVAGGTGKGFFFAPVLLQARDSAAAKTVHEHEVFGPVATLLPYDGTAKTAIELIRRGQGGLVSSAYSDDRAWITETVHGMAPYLGRICIGSAKIAGQAPGPGTVMPQLIHGGPGRAGGGEELGGLRGLSFYSQRTALQGDRSLLDAIT